ncbi:unnamed protein product [Rotaria sordida]|uniref:Uncharacterized protein n=1 Tax=Rotaria sordida TaxID=392033 RepID=A0A813VYU3_9BILA|nr:unnamed protein product [Rotaria sordida]
MKQEIQKEEKSYTISWQQFRANYAALDILTNKGVPQQVHLSLLADGTWSTVVVVWITYYYKVGNSKAWSNEISFKTDCPAVTTHTFAVMGDMGTVIPAGYLVAKQIKEDHQVTPFSAVVHVGDISYAGTGSKDEIAEIWDIWGTQTSIVLSGIRTRSTLAQLDSVSNSLPALCQISSSIGHYRPHARIRASILR